MDEDRITTAIAAILLVAHIAAFGWALRTKEMGGVLGLNLLISGCVAIYWLIHLTALFGYVPAFQAFVGFEAIVLTTSLVALSRVPIPRGIIWTEFAAHALMICAALAFMLTFKMTRMF